MSMYALTIGIVETQLDMVLMKAVLILFSFEVKIPLFRVNHIQRSAVPPKAELHS